MRTPPPMPWPIYLPKATPTRIITFGLGFSIWIWGGGTRTFRPWQLWAVKSWFLCLRDGLCFQLRQTDGWLWAFPFNFTWRAWSLTAAGRKDNGHMVLWVDGGGGESPVSSEEHGAEPGADPRCWLTVLRARTAVSGTRAKSRPSRWRLLLTPICLWLF